MRTVGYFIQNLDFIAKSAIFPTHLAISGQVLGSHHLEGDALPGAKIERIQHARIVPWREGIDIIFQMVNLCQLSHALCPLPAAPPCSGALMPVFTMSEQKTLALLL